MSTIKPDNDYLLNTVTIDYLRLATFDFKLYCEISAALRVKHAGWRSTKWLQYKMERSQDRVSYGIGEQQRKPHGIFEASGSAAHILAHYFFRVWQADKHKLYCTRIDLQCTRKVDQRPDYVAIHKRIAKPKQLILGDTGNTLYIGNRESDSFWRMYDKTPQDIRLEVELKGKQAKKYWSAFMANESIAKLYEACLMRSRVPAVLARRYAAGEDILDLDAYIDQSEEDLNKKLEWLQQLDGLVYKLCNDHDTKDAMQTLLGRWLEYATKP